MGRLIGYVATAVGVFAGLMASRCLQAKVPAELKAYSRSVRYVHHRDRESVPGSTVVYWYRDGRPDWILPAVETNVDRTVVGKHIDNPTEEAANVLRGFEKTARKARHKDAQTWKNMVKDLEHARDKFIEPEFKDLVTNLLSILDQVPES